MGMALNDILKVAIKGGASDIHLKSGLPPMFRVDGALVPLKDGENRIEVVASASNGQRSAAQIILFRRPDAVPLTLPAELAERRTALLEDCLSDLKEVGAALRRQRDHAVRRSLQREIERERRRALERAEMQRRSLEVTVEEP